MQSLKTWQLLALVFLGYLYGSAFGLEIIPCFPAVKNGPCNMTCKVPDNSQQVEINCNGTSRASCSIVYCHPDMIKEGTDTIRFKISSLSYTRDNCEWTCSDGIVPSPGINVTIYSGFSGSLILTNQTNEDKINLTATAECVYPSNTTVRVQYREEQDTSGQYQSLTQQVGVQSFQVPGNCGFDIEKRIVATYEVSRKHSLLGGKSVFIRMEFLQYQSATPNYTNDVGPFTFDKSPDSEENQASNAGTIAGGVLGGLALVGGFVGGGYYFKKRKGKGGLSQNDNGNLENNTGSKTTKDEEGKQSPPTSASKIQLADKLKS